MISRIIDRIRISRRRREEERRACVAINERMFRSRAVVAFTLSNGRRVEKVYRAQFYHDDPDDYGVWATPKQIADREIRALCRNGFFDGDVFIAPAAIVSGQVVREYEEPNAENR